MLPFLSFQWLLLDRSPLTSNVKSSMFDSIQDTGTCANLLLFSENSHWLPYWSVLEFWNINNTFRSSILKAYSQTLWATVLSSKYSLFHQKIYLRNPYVKLYRKSSFSYNTSFSILFGRPSDAYIKKNFIVFVALTPQGTYSRISGITKILW